MAKLSEAIKDKEKKGKWWSIKDVTGKTLTVTEDFGEMFDIRMDKTYYCVQVTDGKEIKDLHLPKGGLKGVAKAFQGVENWKGGKFVITGVTESGYQTETHVSRLQGDYAPGAQARLPTTPQGASTTSSPGNIPVDPKAAAIAATLEEIKQGVGVHESRLDDVILGVCIKNGYIVSMSEVRDALKYGGRIKNEGGVWKVV